MTTDDMRREFEAWYCKEYGDMFPLARWTAEGDYHSPKAVKHWKTWQAAYTRPVPAGVVEALNEADNFLSRNGNGGTTEGHRQDVLLQIREAIAIVKAHPQPAPVRVGASGKAGDGIRGSKNNNGGGSGKSYDE